MDLPDNLIGDTKLYIDSGGTAIARILEINQALVSVEPEGLLETGDLITIDRTEVKPGILRLFGGYGSVEPGLVLNTNGLLELLQGRLEMMGGIMSTQTVDNQALSVIVGNGTIQDVTMLSNAGLIQAENGDLHIIGSPGVAQFDLDVPSEAGRIETLAGSVFLQGALSETFDGTMLVGRQLSLSEPWIVGMYGLLEFQNTSTRAILSAPTTVVESYGRVNVGYDVLAAMTTALSLEPSSYIAVSERGSLILQQTTTYHSPTVSGLGTVHQVGDVIVDADTEIWVQRYEWDGESYGIGKNETKINNGNTFTIEQSICYSPASDGYDGEVTIEEDAVLVVTEPWKLDGTMYLLGGTVRSGELTNNGAIVGEGVIEVDFINSGIVFYTEGGLTFTGSYSGSLPVPLPIPEPVPYGSASLSGTEVGSGPIIDAPIVSLTGPNLFRGETEFRFTTPTAGIVSARIFDIRGRLVRTLLSGPVSSGDHRLSWDGCDRQGTPTAAGVYFLHTEFDGVPHVTPITKYR